MAKEMETAVDSEVGQGEIKEMRFEIHRMKVLIEKTPTWVKLIKGIVGPSSRLV